MKQAFFEILSSLAVTNYDNGYEFTKTDRLDAIAQILSNTRYRKVNTNGLFHLYALDGMIPKKAVLISTHIDCVKDITKCFAEDYGIELLRGTFDNLITNAVSVSLMLETKLRENVLIAFTGDEEDDATGARDVTAFLRSKGCDFSTIVLDVTNMGYEDAHFTVENNFWEDELGKAIIHICEEVSDKWIFVPSDCDDIPPYVPKNKRIPTEAWSDESWEYDESDIQCFSLCIPTEGEMHANSGLLIKKEALAVYTEVLERLANGLTF